MSCATSMVAAPPLRSVLSTVGVVPPTILTSVGPVLDPAVPDVAVPDVAVPDVAVPDVAVPDVAVPDVAVPEVAVAGVMADLALVLSAACPGGLSGVLSLIHISEPTRRTPISYAVFCL